MTVNRSHPLDRHVGERLRQRRVELRLSQGVLASRLGVSFQAVQKYESGKVRISASRLYDAALALDAAPAYFFDGYGEAGARPAPAPGFGDIASLLRGYAGIRDPRLREKLCRLIASLGEGG